MYANWSPVRATSVKTSGRTRCGLLKTTKGGYRQVSDWGEQMQQARREADELHDRAMRLGYNASFNFGGTFGREPEVSFWVRRIDQPSETRQTFASVDEVKEHLEHLATLPPYWLDLEGNTRVEVVSDADGTATRITDKDTGQSFGVRTADLENTTRLCVHAESPPTIGNWRKE